MGNEAQLPGDVYRAKHLHAPLTCNDDAVTLPSVVKGGKVCKRVAKWIRKVGAN
jgi:hypothetical protein